MRIREKLLSLPSVVLVFMVILGVVAIFAMKTMSNSARDIYAVQFKKYQLSTAALDDARAANIGVYRLFTWLNNYNETQIKAVAAEINQKIDAATGNVRELSLASGVTTTDQENMQQVLKSLTAYKKDISQAIEMAEVDPNMGLTSMQTADKTFLKLQLQIQEVVAVADKTAKQQYEKTLATSDTAITGFVVILLVAIVFSVAISLWLGGKIINSLQHTITIAKRIARGDNRCGRRARAR